MHFRALLSLALYALAFVLGPGLHQLLPAGACADCAGEHSSGASAREEADGCCAHAQPSPLPDPGPSEFPQPGEGDHEHCPEHCGVCRVVHGTAQDLPVLVLATGLESEGPALAIAPRPEPPTVFVRPREARAPPVLG